MPENSKIRFYVTEQLSENIAETPEGYLLCSNVPITRIGEFLYKSNEMIGKDGKALVEATPDGVVRIQRDEKDVFADITIKSFEGKPFTLNHPNGFVGPENWGELAHGTVQNVRRGENGQGDLMLADILVTTEEAIKLIKAGQRELSCGYDAEYEQIEKGIGRQVDIIGNHVALVSKGRAGGRCAIQDKACTDCGECHCHKTTDSEQEVNMTDKKLTIKEKVIQFLDGLGIKDAEETEEEKKKREAEEAKKAEEKKEQEAKDAKKTKDDAMEGRLGAVEADLKEIKGMLQELLSEEEGETQDAEAIAKQIKDAEEAEAKKEEEKKAEEKKAEEEKKETSDCEAQWPDLVSHAEILVPGLKLVKPTKDHYKTMDGIKIDVLAKAVANADYGEEIGKLFKVKNLSKLTTDALDVAFLAASGVVASRRNRKIQRSSAKGVHDQAVARTVAEINAANKTFYGSKEKR
jgi:uncharacterized protein